MALRPCLGCRKLVKDAARCERCHREMMRTINQRQDENRPTSAKRGYDWQHKQWRLQVLNRDGWVCQYCGGKATTADHVLPLSTHPELRLDIDNGKACCAGCQNRKGDQQRRSG